MITNLNNTHLTDAQVRKLELVLTQLEEALAGLTVNLTPEERQRYGTINEQNKLLVNKVRDYRQSHPTQSSPEVDWTEFEKDFNSRSILGKSLTRLDAARERLANAKILHDYDNYQAALEDYAWTSYKAGGKTPGYETKQSDLKQFFNRTGTRNKAREEPKG